MSENVESADEEEKINELASYIVKYFKMDPNIQKAYHMKLLVNFNSENSRKMGYAN